MILHRRRIKSRRPVDPDLFAIAVAALCITDDNILLVRRALDDPHMPGSWSVPAGHIQRGETLEHALKRELAEETGLHLTQARLIGTSTYTEKCSGSTSLPVVQLNYLVRTSGEVRPATSEVHSVRWVSWNSLDTLVPIDDFTRGIVAQGRPREGELGDA